jgi:hypothetical protein
MSTLTDLSIRQLKQAVAISEQIESLEDELNRLLESSAATAAPATGTGRRKVSAAGRARMAAAQKTRWAKIKGNGDGTTDRKPRRKMSAAGRARIAATARARWAKAKAAGKNRL